MDIRNFRKEFWLKSEDERGGYNNEYSSITICGKLSGEELKKLERMLMTKYAYTAFYGLKGENFVSFDMHKSFDNAQFFSKNFPGHVVIEDSGWDRVYVELYKDGKPFNDYVASWRDDKEPNPINDEGYDYDESRDDGMYYHCDVMITVETADGPVSMWVGNGLTCDCDFKEMKELVDNHRKIA